jgi:archaellum component FlaC
LTIKELQTLVEQLAAHSNALAEQQSTINKLLTEGMRQTGEQVKALLLVSQQHKERLDNLDNGEGS